MKLFDFEILDPNDEFEPYCFKIKDVDMEDTNIDLDQFLLNSLLDLNMIQDSDSAYIKWYDENLCNVMSWTDEDPTEHVLLFQLVGSPQTIACYTCMCNTQG